MATKENWENEEKIDARTRFAIKILFFIFKVLSPYKFEHRFEKELKRLEDEMDKL